MQSDAFTHHEEWDFEARPPSCYPLLLHYPYFEIYRKQVIKQADLVMALHLRGDAFTQEEKVADFAYYEARTMRDSSLSAAQQAVVAAETGHLELAYDYWAEATLTDLQNLHGNSGHGLHIASMAGGWTVAVAGLRRDARPRRPADCSPRGCRRRLTRLRFRVVYQGRMLVVTVTPSRPPTGWSSGEPLDVHHHGRRIIGRRRATWPSTSRRRRR